jgi:hypothetical protein
VRSGSFFQISLLNEQRASRADQHIIAVRLGSS